MPPFLLKYFLVLHLHLLGVAIEALMLALNLGHMFIKNRFFCCFYCSDCLLSRDSFHELEARLEPECPVEGVTVAGCGKLIERFLKALGFWIVSAGLICLFGCAGRLL